jgi:hypothetical protein
MMTSPTTTPWMFVTVALVLLLLQWTNFVCCATDHNSIHDYYQDLEDVPNPPWKILKQRLPVGKRSHVPALGSTIHVNHTLIQTGLYGRRNLSINRAVHVPTNTHVSPRHFDRITRWYQEDQNTQIFRLFPGDDSIWGERRKAPRSEAYGKLKWTRGDGWHRFSARYTFLKVRKGAVLQIKHNSTYWSMQLVLQENADNDGSFDLCYVKLSNRSEKRRLMENVVGQSMDIMVLDDGDHHKVFVNQKLMVENSMTDRPDGDQC